MRVRHPGWLSLSTTVLLVIALALAIVWFVLGDRSAPSAQDKARAHALDAATRTAVDYYSYDYGALDRQFARVASELTGSALHTFTQARPGITTQFTKSKITSTAQVLDAGIVPGAESRSRFTALVALTVRTRTQDGQSTARQIPLTMQLVRGDSGWLADRIAPVG